MVFAYHHEKLITHCRSIKMCGGKKSTSAIDHPGAPDTGSRHSGGLCSGSMTATSARGSLPSPLMTACLSWSSRPRLVLLLTIGTTSLAWDSTSIDILSQLLRTPRTVTVDPPVAGVGDFSYQADASRHCRDQFCDRHLVHPHACNIYPQNQKLRTGMTRSSWCALSWSRRLAAAGFWLSQALQLWERGLTRASGEATCF